MISTAVASRYASALADVAKVKPEQVLAEMRTFESVLSSSLELRNALTSPAVARARKRAVIEKLTAQMGLSQVVRNFLLVLTNHRRTEALAQIIEQFDLIVDQRMGFVRAEIASPQELDDGQQQALSAELAKLTGKKVRMRFSLDPALIGGVVARIGSTVYDGSVRGRLAALGRKLAAE